MTTAIKNKVYERVYKNGTIVQINVYSKKSYELHQFMTWLVGWCFVILAIVVVSFLLGNTVLSTYSITEVVSTSK